MIGTDESARPAAEGELLVAEDGTIRSGTRILETTLGYVPRNLRGMSFLELVHPDQLELVQQGLRRAAGERPTTPASVRLRHRDGTWRDFAILLRHGPSGVALHLRAHGDEEPRVAASPPFLTLREVPDSGRLEEVLRNIARFVESNAEGTRCCVFLIENELAVSAAGEHAAQSTPGDIVNDPLWADGAGRVLADLDLRASWSEPLVASDGRILGVLAVRFPAFREPQLGELELFRTACRIATSALERQRAGGARIVAQLASDRAEDPIFGVGPSGDLVYANEAARRLTGYPAEELFLLRMGDLVPLFQEEGWTATMATGGSTRELTSTLRTKDGGGLPVELTVHHLQRDGSEYWSIAAKPVPARAERPADETDETYALAARGANDGLWTWNLESDRIDYSPRWKSMLGWHESEIEPKPDEWLRRIHPEDREAMRQRLDAHLEGRSAHFESEHRMLCKDGTYRWVLSRGLAVRNERGKATCIAGSQTDISKRKLAEERLLHDAFHDTLTGLPNRALFISMLNRLLGRVRRRKDFLFGVLFLDFDRFKVINDSLGHMAGDELLVAIADRLKACVRPGDTVARLGGDEFTILLHNVADVTDATRVADRIHRELREPFSIGGTEIFVTASIGIAMGSSGYQRPEELLRDADTAMYRAKARGKARHEVFDATMHARAMEQLQLETDLRKAVERGEFRLHYQPIVSLVSGRVMGFEALTRWRHPQKGLVSPAEFLAIAEETGLIVPIGWWCLREACRQMREWQSRFPGGSPLTVSVNLSSRQFSQPDLVDQTERILRETSLPPECLTLEITESGIMENAESAVAILSQLRSLRVHLHMDDFGTGYSSLGYLHRFQIDTLKIDRSFVGNMGARGDNWITVRTILMLAQNLGMNVIAEGVEREEQLLQLRELDCPYGQGDYFSPPVAPEIAVKIIERGI